MGERFHRFTLILHEIAKVEERKLCSERWLNELFVKENCPWTSLPSFLWTRKRFPRVRKTSEFQPVEDDSPRPPRQAL